VENAAEKSAVCSGVMCSVQSVARASLSGAVAAESAAAQRRRVMPLLIRSAAGNGAELSADMRC